MDRRLTNWKCGLPKDVKLKLRGFGALALIASIEQSRTAGALKSEGHIAAP